jgi:hypothetical protein
MKLEDYDSVVSRVEKIRKEFEGNPIMDEFCNDLLKILKE